MQKQLQQLEDQNLTGINQGIMALEVEPETKRTKLQSHKVETTVDELVYYLEELYQMDMLDEKEMDIYERYQYGQRIGRREWLYVANNAYQYQFEAF